jgi:hypothetical protein
MPLLTTTGSSSARTLGLTSNAKEVPTVIGQVFGGGYYAGLYSLTGNGVATHYLIVSPKSSGFSSNLRFSTTSVSFTNSNFDGKTNSAAMNTSANPAAFFCEGLTIGGYSDWYLPSRYELERAYTYFKPTEELNRTSPAFGANPYAVPASSNYTSTNPLMTTVGPFNMFNQSEWFPDDLAFWSSTSVGLSKYAQKFNNGEVLPANYANYWYVRAFRREPI